jgi:hypothetical protein
MHSTKTTIRRLACIAALVITALAAFGGGAGAALGASGSMTDAEHRALMIRSEALNRMSTADAGATGLAEKFIPGATDFPSRLGEAGERAAEARLAERGRQGLPVYVQVESGFDWSSAATGAIAATLLLFGAALAVRTAKRSSVAVG